MESQKEIMQRIITPGASSVDAMGNPVPRGAPAAGLASAVGLGSVGQTVSNIAQAVMGPATTAPHFTNNFGNAAGDMSHSLNIQGHPVVSDVFLMEKQQLFNRSKTLERAVHACGSGAFGYFQVTGDVSKFTKATFLSGIGKKTPLAGRFSTVTYGREFPDSARNPRGLAFKFYTEEGNYDVLTINFPAFFCRDPIHGPDVIRTQSRNPENFLINFDAMFDFMSLVPESMHANMWYWSDHGTPRGWRFMDGYACHTFKWVNASSEEFFVKYKFRCDQGIQNFDFPSAVHMCGVDPDFAKRDLWQTIHEGGQATWTWQVQVMPVAVAAAYKWDPFDNTKAWPETDFPYIEVGKLVFNKNPENNHRDVEQLAFSPGRLVSGIEPSPDPLLQFRSWFYSDAQFHRLGTNYHQIPVNCPFMTKIFHPFGRDGESRADTNGGAEPHYLPNSVPLPLGVKPNAQYNWRPEAISGVLDRKSACKHENTPDDEYVQAREFFLTQLDQQHRRRTHLNIAKCLSLVTHRDIQIRFLSACFRVHPEFCAGIINEMQGLGKTDLSVDEIGKLSAGSRLLVDQAAGYVPLVCPVSSAQAK